MDSLAADAPAPPRAFWATLWRMLGFLEGHRVALWASIVLAVLGQGITVLIPWLVGRTVDEAIRGEDAAALRLHIGLIVVAGVVRLLVMMARRLVTGKMAVDVEAELRERMYAHLQRLSFRFYDRHQTGQLMARATVDLTAVRVFVAYGLLFFTQHGVTIVAVLAVLTVTDPLLALIAVAITPALVAVAARYSRVSHPVLQEAQQRLADVTTQAEENVVGVRVVKAFGQEARETARFRDRSEAVFAANVRANRQRAVYLPLLDFLPTLGVAGVLLGGAWAVDQGRLTLGGFVTFTFLLALLVFPLRMLGMWIGQAQRAIASGQRVFAVLDVEPDIVDRPDARDLPPGGGAVRFEGVRFGYDAERPVLDGLDLAIEPGSTVAVIGPTGSGKSTLTALVPRFYDVDAGRVLVDGVDVRDLRIASLRRAIGIVSQETFLFSATVRENIAFGRPDATDDEVRDAAARAQAAEFIEALPEGYDTVIGERGLTLSGGQRQRLAIARAFLVDPRILILDDATASVDATTEARIRAALAEVMADRTTIIVGHRLSTIALADRVVAIDDGRVVADGDHDALLGSSDVYREIYEHGLVERAFVDFDGDRVVLPDPEREAAR